MTNTEMSRCDRSFETLISDFCDIILTTKDCLSLSEAKSYVERLTDGEKSCLNQYAEDDPLVHGCVNAQVIEYIQKFQVKEGYLSNNLGSPFEFDNSTNYEEYRSYFETEYKRLNNNAHIPSALKYAFRHIKEMSEHYRVFEQFYVIRAQRALADIWEQVKDQVASQAKQQTQQTINESVEQAASAASQRASVQARRLAEQARDKAEKAVDEAVEKHMLKVSAKVTETSVTILGIFAGIVLTIVAGLFYSSSVIENATASNFYRLMSVSALVGFVCFNLIAIMFRYISKIKGEPEKRKDDTTQDEGVRTKNEPKFPLSKMSLFVSVVLVAVMVVFAILELK